MKATIDGITYEGTEDEIRRIVENPPHRPPVDVPVEVTCWPDGVYPKLRRTDGKTNHEPETNHELDLTYREGLE